VRRLPIRIRLSLVLACTLALVLAALGVLVYDRHRTNLDAAIDQGLIARAGELKDLSRGAPGPLAATRFAEPDETLDAILTPAGAVLDATPNVDRRALRRQLDLSTARIHPAARETTMPGFDSRVRLLAFPLGDRRVGVVGVALADRDDALGSLEHELMLSAPLAILAAALVGYAFAAAALRPVEAMRRRAASISAAPGDERLPLPPARDELQRLAETLNAMIGRLHDAVERERRFAADASHELRTPLALLRAELDLALDGHRSRAELVRALHSASEETERLIRLAEDLLLLARVDDHQLALTLRPFGARALLDRIADRFGPAANACGRSIETDCARALTLLGDEPALERALANLVGNALLHGAGTIVLRARAEPPQLWVSDEGGSSEPAGDLFQRFRRGPGGAPGGSGLGLAIVAAIADAHGGTTGASAGVDRFDAWITLPPAAERAASPRQPRG
jgi:two-component system OmpR family sensor kinase